MTLRRKAALEKRRWTQYVAKRRQKILELRRQAKRTDPFAVSKRNELLDRARLLETRLERALEKAGPGSMW